MYQRSAPAKAPDISDVHAVVRELAGVLVRQSASQAVPAQPARAIDPATAPGDADADDARMPIPSTWREPPGAASPATEVAPWRTGLIGLILGLCLTLPTVLWLTGNLSAPLSWLGWGRVQASERGGTAPAVAAEVAWPASFGRGSAVPVASDGSASPPPPGAESPASITTTAELLISGGDVVLARNLLERHATAGKAEVLFALAETYDPNMLAAWGVRDLRADADRARSLYERALSGGVDKARGRLLGLQ
jgi:hypothetical protein